VRAQHVRDGRALEDAAARAGSPGEDCGGEATDARSSGPGAKLDRVMPSGRKIRSSTSLSNERPDTSSTIAPRSAIP
jgi:hypothetical protein